MTELLKTSQSMTEGLNSNIAQLKTDQSVLQDFYKRIERLEQMPDVKNQVLNDYARNFDIIDEHYKKVIAVQKQLNINVLGWMRQMNKSINAINIVFDADTLRDLNFFLEKQLGMNLRDYVTDVQNRAISNGFESLETELNNSVKIQKTYSKRLKTLENSIDYLGDRIGFYFNAMMLFVTLGFVISLPAFISAFASHPIFSMLVFIAFGVFAWYWYKRTDESSGDDKDD